MKQPLWKRLLSYLTEVHLESASTDLNPTLHLALRKGRYCLTTPNAIYSYGDLYDNFLRAFRKLDLDKMAIQDVLILGFGMGSIPYMLEKVFHKNYRYVGVEQDEVIALWASRYVLRELRSPVQLQIADARRFTEYCEEKFDLVVVDIFVDDVVPPAFEEPGFLEALQNLLSDNGLLLYNRLTAQPGDQRATTVFFEDVFKKTFPKATFLDVHGNWMLKNH